MTAALVLVILVDLFLKASLVAAAGLAVRACLRGQSAARRHLVSLMTVVVLACLLAAPLWQDAYRPWWIPETAVAGAERISPDDYTLTAIGKLRAFPDESAPLWARAAPGLVALWLGVATLLLIRLAAGVAGALSLFRVSTLPGDTRLERLLTETSQRLGSQRRPALLLSSQVRSPMAWGPPLPRLLFPVEALQWNDAQLRMTLRHELGHIERVDSLTQLLARAVCAVLWFHPLVLLIGRSLLRDQEQACDDLVVESGGSPTSYARHLLATLEIGCRPAAWSHLHSRPRSPLGQRVARLLASDTRRHPVSRAAAVVGVTLSLAVGLGWSAPFGTLGLAAPQSSAPQLDAETVQPLVDVFSAELKKREIPGGVIVVVRDGTVVLSEGVGLADKDANRPADPERTIFRIGSITKPVTAIALLGALDEKGISVDTPVAEYVDIDVPSVGAAVTFRHLLTHTGGFDQLGYNRHSDDAAGVLPLADFLRDNLVAYQPAGVVSTYDTYGISLAGLLLERLTGLEYSDAVIARVFRPMGMASSGFGGPGPNDQVYARGYSGSGAQMQVPRWEFHHTVPASTANSTAADMARLMVALLDDCALDGGRLMSSTTCRQMLDQQFSNHPRLDGYGFGFLTDRRNGHRVVQHGGSMDGFSALLWLMPDEKTGLFLAYNREDGRPGSAVSGALMDRFFPAPETPLEPRWTGSVDTSRFTGSWVNTLRCHSCEDRTDYYWRANPFEITADDQGRLIVGGGPSQPIAPLLFQRDDGLLIGFREDADREITHMFIRQTVYERPSAAPAAEASGSRWVHPPCPTDCGAEHSRISDEPTVCPICSMNFVGRPSGI